MEQQRALNALQKYLALSKNARTPSAAADLVTKATSDPSTYVFAELLQTPQIQTLRSDASHAKYLTLLEIFAWGTWSDYKNATGLPELNSVQTRKLRQLTLISLLSAPPTTTHENTNLTYAHLQSGLGITNQTELESLLTLALSAGLLTGHLDPLHQRAQITAVAPLRDIAPGSAPKLVSVLEDWEERCDETAKDLKARIQAIRNNAKERYEREQAQKEAFEKAIATLHDEDEDGVGKTRGTAKRKEPGKGDADVMDVGVDGNGLKMGTKSAKKFLAKGLRK